MAPAPPLSFTVHRADLPDRDRAWAIVEEYNTAIGIQVRDTRPSFARDYFGAESGLWLAVADQQIIGCIALRPLALAADFGSDPAAEVKRLYVQPAFRGRGVAEVLLAALEAHAREHGYRALYLDSKDDLQAALRFYARHGYQRCGRYNDNPQATIFMHKQLEE
jgi:ribosomal protein S18 acetylase RimI-like enzyme